MTFLRRNSLTGMGRGKGSPGKKATGLRRQTRCSQGVRNTCDIVRFLLRKGDAGATKKTIENELSLCTQRVNEAVISLSAVSLVRVTEKKVVWIGPERPSLLDEMADTSSELQIPAEMAELPSPIQTTNGGFELPTTLDTVDVSQSQTFDSVIENSQAQPFAFENPFVGRISIPSLNDLSSDNDSHDKLIFSDINFGTPPIDD